MCQIVTELLFNPFLAVTAQSVFSNYLSTRIQLWIDKSDKKKVFNEALENTKKEIGDDDDALYDLVYRKKDCDVIFTFTENEQFDFHFRNLKPSTKDLLIKNLKIAFREHARMSDQIFNDWMVKTVNKLLKLAKEDRRTTNAIEKAVNEIGSKLWDIQGYSAYTLIMIANMKDDTKEIKDEVKDIRNVIQGLPKIAKNTEEILKLLKTNDREKKTPKQKKIPLRIPAAYTKWMKTECKAMDINKLITKGEAIQVGLPAVYIPLLTNDFPKMKERAKKERKTDEFEIPEESDTKPVDVEDLVAREPYLLLEGDPGSGKTTMMKHLALDIVTRKRLPQYLPVLVYLNELKDILDSKEYCTEDIPMCWEILDAYFKKKKNGLSEEIVSRYCDAGRAVFLLDGLDELDEEYRKEVIGSFCKAHTQSEGTKVVVTTRPHAVQDGMHHLGDKHRKINSLAWEQKEDFVHKWFEHLEGKNELATKENSERLLDEMRNMGEIMEFVTTPLILTAVCILYMDERKLPEQRADLYNRIINNLVEKRFKGFIFQGKKIEGMADLVHRFLGLLALTMMKSEEKEIDRVEAENLLRKIFRKERESDEEHHRRIRKLFEVIEPNCGLLDRTKGSLSFYHLTYQEFLTARHIVTTKTDYWEAIMGLINEKWWREMILLYIGFLSKDNRAWANKVIKKLLESENAEHWILAAHGFLDLLVGQRDPDLLDEVKEKMRLAMISDLPVKIRFDAGEALGRLGDPRLDNDNFVTIPAGEFLRGLNEKIDAKDWELPQRKIYLNGFEIGKYLVTNQEYREFVNDDGYEKEGLWSEKGWIWKMDKGISEPRYWHDRKWNGSNFPVVGISWHEAEAYARWLSKRTGLKYRFPTEAEWEKAARGTKGITYPWGVEFDKNRCNYDECGLDRTSPAGIFPAGKSPDGCLDMSGNVWEWCSDWFGEHYYRKSTDTNPKGPRKGSDRVVRGGGWFSDAECCAATVRSGLHPSVRDDVLGFRLARSL